MPREMKRDGTLVGVEGVGEGVVAHIGLVVGAFGGLEEGEAEDVTAGGVAVLAIVEEGGAVAAFAEVEELVAAHLILCHLPGCIAHVGSAQVAILDVAGDVIGSEVEREVGPQDLVCFVPGDGGFEVDSLREGMDDDHLCQH